VVIVTMPQKAVPELPRGFFAGSTAGTDALVSVAALAAE
jgi:hypothetical protein